MVKNLGLAGKVLIGATMLATAGCRMDRALSRAIGQDLLVHGAREAISHEVNPRETNVTVNNSQCDNSQRIQIPPHIIKGSDGFYYPEDGYVWNSPKNFVEEGVSRYEEKLVVRYFRDDNRDGKVDIGEVMGMVSDDTKIDFYKEDLVVDFDSARKGSVVYTVRNSGDLISQSPKISQNPKVAWRQEFITSKNSIITDTPNWIDKFKIHAIEHPGTYTLYVSQEGLDKIFSQEIIITD